jgi:hypothetical protein
MQQHYIAFGRGLISDCCVKNGLKLLAFIGFEADIYV